MFTGIIESTAKVIEKTDRGITVECPATFNDIKIGSSISVSGVCLSIVEFDVTSMRFDVIDETWAKTNLGDLRVGNLVNLERAMKAGDRLDGHVVQGHIEGVGEVVSCQLSAESSKLTIRVPQEFTASIVTKGSIALDGVSLTVADIQDDIVTVALIPHTLTNTTLQNLKEGDRVNVETDVLIRSHIL